MAIGTLTLSMDEQLIRRLERLAEGRKLDVNSLAIRMLTTLTETSQPVDPADLPPNTRAAIGVLKGLPNKPYKQLVEDAISEKYGIK